MSAKTIEIPMGLVTNVGGAATGITSSILTAIAGNTLESLKPNITTYLNRNASIAAHLKTEAIENVDNYIWAQINNDYITIIDAIKAGIGQGVGNLHGSLFEQLMGTNALLSGINSIIQQAGINPYISRLIHSIATPNIPDAETAWYMHRLGRSSVENYNGWLLQNGWGSDWNDILHDAWLRPLPIPSLLDLYRRGVLSEDFLTHELLRYRISDECVGLVKQLRVQMPDPYLLAEIRSVGIATDDQYYKATRWFGIPDEYAYILGEAYTRFPDEATALILLRRGLINDDTFRYFMQRSRMPPEASDTVLQLREVIPSPSDLTYMAAREAFGDHSYAAQLPALEDLITKQGWTKQMADDWWYAHWRRTELPQAYANLWRGLWDTAKFMDWLTIVDIHPDDRQDILNVAFQPPTVRELGYGFDVGVYTIDDIKRYRRFGGLSVEDASKAATALVAYRLETVRKSIADELLYAYGLRRISRDELQTQLTALPVPTASLPYWMQRADLYQARIQKPLFDTEGLIVSSAEAIAAFKAGLRDEAWLTSHLQALGWNPDRVTVTVEKAKYDISDTKKTVKAAKEKTLTISEIRQLYTIGDLTQDQMKTAFINLGYSDASAAALVDIYTATKATVAKPKAFPETVAARSYQLLLFDETELMTNFEELGYSEAQAAYLVMYTNLTQELPRLQALYEKGIITSDDIIAELQKMGISLVQATNLVNEIIREYQIARLTVEKQLTKAEIIKGVKNKVFTATEGAQFLVDLGYDVNEANYILAINGVVSAGDPEGYWEMRKITELFKKASGKPYVNIPDEVITLEKQINQTKAQINDLKAKGASEEEIAKAVLMLNSFERHMRDLIVKFKLK